MSIREVFIKNVKVQNYRSLEDASVTLNKGLNIIIGDNGAGKSNFLKFLKNHVADVFQNMGYDHHTEHLRGINYYVELSYKDARDQFLLEITCYENGAAGKTIKNTKAEKSVLVTKLKNGNPLYSYLDVGGPLRFEDRHLIKERGNLKDLLTTTLIHFSSPDWAQYITGPGSMRLSARTNIIREEPEYYKQSYISPLFTSFNQDIEVLMEKHGGKADAIGSLIQTWFNKKKKENQFAALLKKYTPVQDIKLNENINVYKADYDIIVQNIVLNFKINNHWVPWSYLSDGTIRLFHIITEVLFGNSNIVLIEEPELGIHPNQLFRIMDFLKVQSLKKQIIISTHSPISLDVLSPDELDAVIITKMTKKGTVMQHLNKAQKDKAKAYIKKVGNLSAYWVHSDLEQ